MEHTLSDPQSPADRGSESTACRCPNQAPPSAPSALVAAQAALALAGSQHMGLMVSVCLAACTAGSVISVRYVVRAIKHCRATR